MQKTALIIEDEYPAMLRMAQLLQNHDNKIKVIGEADTGKKAIALIEEKKPDLIFLDIQLPDMTGFDILQQIHHQPWIIFTTAYPEFALKAFENYSIDYLVKPIEQKRFDQAIEKLAQWECKANLDKNAIKQLLQNIQPTKPSSSLAIKKKDKIVLVDFEDIVFLNAEDKYVNVIMKNGKKHLMSTSLTQISTTLPNQFIQIHRSYIVNKNYVLEIQKSFKGKFTFQLSDENENKITSGETYTAIIKSAFGF